MLGYRRISLAQMILVHNTARSSSTLHTSTPWECAQLEIGCCQHRLQVKKTRPVCQNGHFGARVSSTKRACAKFDRVIELKRSGAACWRKVCCLGTERNLALGKPKSPANCRSTFVAPCSPRST